MPVWKHSQFTTFFKSSPRKAFEYRKECLWDEIPLEYMTDAEKKWVKAPKTPVNTPTANETVKEDITPVEVVEKDSTETVETVETLSIEDMRKILDNNDIKYSHLAKEKGLSKLLEENKLI